MQVSGQERHDDRRLKTGDFESIHCLSTLPVRQQRLRQPDRIVVFVSGCLLVCAIAAPAAINPCTGACEDGTGASKMRIMEPGAGVSIEVSEEKVDNKGSIERIPGDQLVISAASFGNRL